MPLSDLTHPKLTKHQAEILRRIVGERLEIHAAVVPAGPLFDLRFFLEDGTPVLQPVMVALYNAGYIDTKLPARLVFNNKALNWFMTAQRKPHTTPTPEQKAEAERRFKAGQALYEHQQAQKKATA